jgi:hypothetical protein
MGNRSCTPLCGCPSNPARTRRCSAADGRPAGSKTPRPHCATRFRQDGFNSDQARGFAATPQPFLFGVCAPGGTSPICAADPGTMPKAMDVITPSGVNQATELDPALGSVVVRAVPVP